MTLQDLGNIGELVGGFAVVISLIYLAIQVRQNTQQMQENSRVSRLLMLGLVAIGALLVRKAWKSQGRIQEATR